MTKPAALTSRVPGAALGLGTWSPVALALVAEAAWIAVINALLQAVVQRPPTMGVSELLLAAIAGLLAARVLGPRRGSPWAKMAILLAAACGIAGWLWPEHVRAVLVAQGPAGLGAALVANPAGWLAVLAYIRGMTYASPPIESRHLGTLLTVVVPVLAVVAIVGGTLHEPWRRVFTATAEIQVLLFLATVLPALALARLAEVASGTVVDWRRNPGWLVMVGLLLGAMVALAVWASAGAGPAISAVVWALAAPLLLVGVIWSIDRRGVQFIVSSLMALGVAGLVVVALATGPGAALRALLPLLGLNGGQAGNPVITAVLAVITAVVVVAPFVLAIAAVAALVRSRLRLRGPGMPGATDDEVREIDRTVDSDPAPRTGRRRLFRRRAAPTDAVTAYLALLQDLDGRPVVARVPGETPAEHAGRLRGAGLGDLRLDLLAADYGLVQFGGIVLTAAEHRRAVVRAAVLRPRLAPRSSVRRRAGSTAPPA